MTRPSNPSNVVVGVEGYPLFTVLGADQLQTVVVNKDRGGAALPSIGLHGLLDGIDRKSAVLMISKTWIELSVSEPTWSPSSFPYRQASR